MLERKKKKKSSESLMNQKEDNKIKREEAPEMESRFSAKIQTQERRQQLRSVLCLSASPSCSSSGREDDF